MISEFTKKNEFKLLKFTLNKINKRLCYKILYLLFKLNSTNLSF